MKLILFLIGLFMVIQSIFTIHQTLTNFLKDNLRCYVPIQERSFYGDSSQTYKIGIRYQNYSRSMETLINLIEKIENSFEEKSRRISAEALTKHLLKSYHIYGLSMDKFNIFDVKKYHLLYDELTDILLDSGGSNTRNEQAIRDILTPEEQCIMHYMLSRFEHPLDEVQTNPPYQLDKPSNNRLAGKQEEDAWNQVKRRMNSKNMQFRNPEPLTSQNNIKYDFYEQGVVRFRTSETDAIEPSRVLFGVLIGLANNIPKFNNKELFEKLMQLEGSKIDQYIGNLSSINNEVRLDVLPALTISDLWAQNSHNTPSQTGNRKKTTQSGQWDSNVCPIYYQMQPSTNNQQNTPNNKYEFNGLSLAQLRGGLDGLSIGFALQNKKLPKNLLKLSTILKMYYSPRGLAVESSFCRRVDIFDLFLKAIKNPAVQYLQLIHLYLTKGQIKDEFEILPLINENEMDFQSKLSDAASVSDENRAYCQDKPFLRSSAIRLNPNAYNGLSDELSSNSINAFNRRKSKFSILNADDSSQPNKYSETPNDLIFLVDLSNGLNQQLAIINKIVSQQTMYDNETVTILLNRPGKDEFEESLEAIAWRSPIKDKPICDLKNLIMTPEKSTYTITKAAELIDRIDHILTKFKSEQNITMIAGKVFILFNYGSIKHDQSQEFLSAKRNLFIEHRDVRYAIIGQGDRNDLKNLVNFKDNDDSNVFEVNSDLDSLSLNVNKLITDNSAIVMYGRSHLYKSRYHETVQENYVTPNAVKFYIISSVYFFASEKVELKFELQNQRNLKICLSRWDQKPSSETTKSSDLQCRSSQEEQQPLIFYLSNPCSGYSLEDCPPIYFGVYGLKDNQQIQPDCFESHCSNFDQIKYEFSHQGVRGSGFAKFLNPIILLIAFLISVCQFTSNYKL